LRAAVEQLMGSLSTRDLASRNTQPRRNAETRRLA
jgi:hypothetical protein